LSLGGKDLKRINTLAKEILNGWGLEWEVSAEDVVAYL
jgi:hypothetical protein